MPASAILILYRAPYPAGQFAKRGTGSAAPAPGEVTGQEIRAPTALTLPCALPPERPGRALTGTWRRDGCLHLSGWLRPEQAGSPGASCSWQVCQRGLGSSQVSREAWSAMFMIFGLVDGGILMTTNGAPAGSSPEASLATPANASAALWRQVALFLAGAAQLITIPARVSPDRLDVLMAPAVGAVAPGDEQASRGRRCEQMSCDPGSSNKAAERCSA